MSSWEPAVILVVRFSRVAVDLSDTAENEHVALFEDVASVILSVFIAHKINLQRFAFYPLVHKNHWCVIDISW